MKILKSWLFVPSYNERYLEKATKVNADALIYDLEDSVSIERKSIARENVKKVLSHHNNIEQIQLVRVNGLDTPFFIDDLDAIIMEGLEGIVLPKVNQAKDIWITEYLLQAYEQKKGYKVGLLKIYPLIETALGLKNTFEIAISSKRIKALMFGAEDYMLETNINSNHRETTLQYARTKIVTDSSAAKLDPPIDAVYPSFRDEEGLINDAIHAKQLGYQGKLAIHPDQTKHINHIFSPSDEEIIEAKKVINTFEKTKSEKASIEVDGKMIDLPIIERYRRLLSYKKN